MKVPKKTMSLCPRCKKHTEFSISIYKKGKKRTLAEGQRRYERKKRGYGSQPKEVFRKNAKINKKTTPLLTCSVCGLKKYGQPQRIKKFEIITK